MPRTGTKKTPRVIPTGMCFCGCGAETGIGAFFARGHDKVAEAAFLAVEHDGKVAHMLNAAGYGPEQSVTREAVRVGMWEECPSKSCSYVGAPESVRIHRQRAGH